MLPFPTFAESGFCVREDEKEDDGTDIDTEFIILCNSNEGIIEIAFSTDFLFANSFIEMISS
jgi:hypothetical protein